MSNFFVNGQDLDGIFMPISTAGGSTAQYPTNFTTIGNVDLQQRYAKYVTGTYAPTTHYISQQYYLGQDLNLIFQNKTVPLSNFVVTGTNYTITGSTGLSGTAYITWLSGTGSIIFNNAPNSNSIIITGGGAGGNYGNYSYYADTVGGNGGNGGGAGSISNIINTTFIPPTTYNVYVGNGGGSGTMPGTTGSLPTPLVAPTNGQSSNFDGYTGNGGLINTGGAGGIGFSANGAPSTANGGTGTGYNGAGGGGGNQQTHPGGAGGVSILGLGVGGTGSGRNSAGSPALSSTPRGSGGNGGGGAAPSLTSSIQYNSGGNGSAGIIGQVYLTVTY